jgi:hypothetical protein
MKRAARFFAATYVVAFMLLTSACARHSALEGAQAKSPASPPARLEAAYGRLPVHFEANRGQLPDEIGFAARTSTGRIDLAPGGFLLSLAAAPVRLSFAGATSAVSPQPLEALPGRVNYYRGSDPKGWYADIPTFARVRYAQVYPGIDVVIYGNQQALEYDFVVAPGADPGKIRVRVEGADSVEPTASGDLTIRRGDRTIVQHAPVAYQLRGDRREAVHARYIVRGGRDVLFEVGAYDRTRPLVIDPVITYAARIGFGEAVAIAVDNAGYAYFTGTNTGAFGNEYPMVNAAFPQRTTGLDEIFVTKLSPDGSSLIYSTYFGGGMRDYVHGIATDGAGNAYITGKTGIGVPTTPGAFQPTVEFKGEDASETFVAKFGPTGALLYSTYLQGRTVDNMADQIRGNVCYQGAGNGIAADSAGNAYVVGFTSTTDFPTTPGAYIPTKPTVGNRCLDYAGGYLTKLSADGSSLVYSTYLDGNGAGLSIIVDGAGNAYVGGISANPSAPPGTVTADLSGGATFSPPPGRGVPGGPASAYLTKFNASGLPTQTTLIGFRPDSISVGPDASIYAAGNSSAGRMNAGGTAWIWLNSLASQVYGIAAAADASAWVVYGRIAQYAADGALVSDTAITGATVRSVDVDSAGNAYVVGNADSTFTTTPGAYSAPPTVGGGCPSGTTCASPDVVVVKLSPGTGGGGGGDTTKPTVAITKPSNGAWTGASINVAATATDNAGLKEIKLWGNGTVFGTIPCSGTTCSGNVWWTTGPLPPAAYEVNAVATDTAGNQTVSATVTIYKDARTPLKPSGATVTGGGGGTTPPQLTAAITSPANGVSVSGDVTVTFGSGNASGTPVYTLKVDNANVIFSGSTSASSVSTPWSTTGYSNGTHTLNLTVTDGAGRTATSAATVMVSNPPPGGGGGDTTKPTVAITKPSSGVWTGASIGLTASATDNVALKEMKLWANGAVFATIPCSGATCSGSVTWTTGPLPPAAYEVNAVATDTAGNQTMSATVTIYKDAKTPLKPSGATATGGGGTPAPLTASITSPANGATVSGNVTVNMTAGGASGTPVFTLKVDNTNVLLSGSTGGSSASTPWSTTGYANGTHTLNLTVTDGAGRTEMSTVTVTVSNPSPGGGGTDATPPSVAITTPSNGAWTGASIGVTASATDNVQVATLTYYGNGTQFAKVTCGTASCTSKQWWTTGALPSGKHTITVVATDAQGNQTTSAPVVINK